MPKQRLKFIDLARSIAILLMLEGHFVGLSLVQEARDDSNPVYFVWNFIRGFTAPLFFTAAGMIFSYLLAGENETAFFKRERVRKGIRRAAELLFWGYALQLNVKNIPDYMHGAFETWVFAFHVLQCIGVGLLFLILIAAAQKALGKAPLVVWYAVAVVFCIAGTMWLKSQPTGAFVPAGWPQIIQNTLSGPRSVFPVLPWLGFAFLGGAMGAYLRSINHMPATLKSCAWFLILTSVLILIWLVSALIPLPHHVTTALSTFTFRAFQVVAFLGILRLVEICYGIGVPWILRIGRETFAIYIMHVIVLYGGLFGYGLDPYLNKNLTPWQAAGGAALFISVFALHGFFLNKWKTRKRSGA